MQTNKRSQMVTDNKVVLILLTLVLACIAFAGALTIFYDLTEPTRLPDGQLAPTNIVNSWPSFIPLAVVFVVMLVVAIRGWQRLLRERRMQKPPAAQP